MSAWNREPYNEKKPDWLGFVVFGLAGIFVLLVIFKII